MVGTVKHLVGVEAVINMVARNGLVLDLGAPLCLRNGQYCGSIVDVFGPLATPKAKIALEKDHCLDVGTFVYYVESCVQWVDPDQLYSKGYDCSGPNDIEISLSSDEFD